MLFTIKALKKFANGAVYALQTVTVTRSKPRTLFCPCARCNPDSGGQTLSLFLISVRGLNGG